jgi:uncharacterized protein
MVIEFHEITKCDLKNPILITGFPGLGLVGTISASYLVEKLNMELLGYITGTDFPPLAAVHDYTPSFPARMYISKKHNLIVLLSEFIIPLSAIYDFTNKIVEFSKEKGVSKIISLGGISIKGEQDSVYVIASSKKLVKELVKNKMVKLIKEGATTGVTGVLLAHGAATKFPVVSLLAEARPEYMDPKAASMVLSVLKDFADLTFDTRELDKEAKMIQDKMKGVISDAKISHEHYKKEERKDLGPMYR